MSQAMPFNLGELMNLSATRSTDGNNVITGLADSMLANLANNNAPTVIHPIHTLSSFVASHHHHAQCQSVQCASSGCAVYFQDGSSQATR